MIKRKNYLKLKEASIKTKQFCFILLTISCLIYGCNSKQKNNLVEETKENKEVIKDIIQRIDSLYAVDQNIQLAHQNVIKTGDKEKIKIVALQQKTIFENHIPILKNMYKKVGYPTNASVGKEISNKFFTLVQHSDADVKFQEKMLKVIKEEVKNGTIDAKNYALLTDRVQLAQNKPQIYGTQVSYNTAIAQVYPKNLLDSVHVNDRRKEIGIESLEEYLNKISEWHFKVNKNHYDKLGITAPKLYEVH